MSDAAHLICRMGVMLSQHPPLVSSGYQLQQPKSPPLLRHFEWRCARFRPVHHLSRVWHRRHRRVAHLRCGCGQANDFGPSQYAPPAGLHEYARVAPDQSHILAKADGGWGRWYLGLYCGWRVAPVDQIQLELHR